MIFRKLTTLLICLMIILCSIDCSVYAAQDSWQNCDTLELQTQAFIAYCKSRDLTIEGSVLDAVTSFTTRTYQDALNGLGLNMNAIQADIKYTTDSNGGLKFLFNVTGAEAMNRIFSQWLQDHDLEVGDEVDDEEVYSGKWFVDADGNGCLVYIYTSTTQIGSYPADQVGTPYRYTAQELINLVGQSSYSSVYHLTSTQNFSDTYTYSAISNGYKITSRKGSNIEYYTRTELSNGSTVINDNKGDPVIIYINQYDKYYIGCYFTDNYYRSSDNTHRITNYASNWEEITRNTVNPVNATIYITTNNTTINNNDYSNNTYTEINNEGDVNNYYGDDEPDPDEPDPDEPSVPDNPYGGTPPNWDIGVGEGEATDGNGNTWNITFPDFELPDLNIDWSISGLGDKFPFSIPFDMVALITALSAEPEAPAFAGTVDFGFTTWDYDIDLSEFDDVAAACRIAELLLLVFGLILITRSIIKG